METEPVSPLIMAVLSFKRKDNGVSFLVYPGGDGHWAFLTGLAVKPGHTFGSSLSSEQNTGREYGPEQNAGRGHRQNSSLRGVGRSGHPLRWCSKVDCRLREHSALFPRCRFL